MKCSRRRFLQSSLVGASAVLSGSVASLAMAEEKTKRKKLPVGLELWSVRDSCQKDLPGVLKAVAEMGYDGVEFAHSFYGHDPESIRKMLDENGLKSCGMHTTVPFLQGKRLDKMIQIHKILGTPFIIVASLPRKTMHSVEGILKTAKWFNEVAEKLKPHGLKIGYHSHAGDFAKLGDSTPWELIGDNTSEDVILQLDTSNCLAGGGDPYAMLKKYPGRTLTVHLKEYGGPKGAVLGEGEVKWNKVFDLCETIGGTQWYVIEEESRKGKAALKAVGRALKNFKRLHG